MPEAVVETKLLVPRLRQRTVPRPRLDALLGRGLQTTLTLVAAPAGFGKTTVLAGWIAQRGDGLRAAWVSLDERDRDPAVFWTHVLHAVERAVPGSAASAIARLGRDPARLQEALTQLVNELGVTADDLALVLDDYHLAESPRVQQGMSFLLEHLPPQVHLVISTRIDPGLPLARLRARGGLVEVRAADLRFTTDESRTYLNEVNALELGAADVATLESRTEGWAAALQLAALSLQGKEDPAQFIADFAGDDRFVVDYLADEVLDRQDADVRTFLLETSVLEELTAPSCDAVTGRRDGRAVLELLERLNLFLVPLDDRRRRYRYHHLFADVLRAHLRDERPQDVAVLHRRAGDWFQSTGDPEAAVRHALAAGDVTVAAERVELAIPDLQRQRREAVIRRWADELPAGVVRDRPVLAIGFVGGLMASNRFEGVAERLDQVERLLGVPSEELVVADPTELPRLPATVQTYRAGLALVEGRPEATVQHAERALSIAAGDDHRTIAAASALLGLASWTAGDLQEAHEAYRTAAEHLERAGHVADVLGCSVALADLETTLGRLREARRTFEHALELTGGTSMRGVADMYVGLSRLAWEQGDPASAADLLRRADEPGEVWGLPQNPYRWRVMLARLRHAEGDISGALDLLAEAQRVYVGDFLPDVQPVAATRARLLVAAGDLDGARAWARERRVTAADEPAYLSEYDHLTLVRLLLAEHRASGDDGALAQATSLLAAVRAAVEEGGRTGTLVEVLALQALCAQAAGDLGTATTTLTEAVRLAEPEGYVRVFLDEGPAMESLLASVVPPRSPLAQRSSRPRPQATAAGVVVEPLSDREVDVLRLLGSDLSGPEIARELYVSLATVRTHTQHIYAKLGVNNRRAAVRRAHQLDLFPRAGH
jgi:LuxR family transcriptional regulator, maltose regulon positive regulatory protein